MAKWLGINKVKVSVTVIVTVFALLLFHAPVAAALSFTEINSLVDSGAPQTNQTWFGYSLEKGDINCDGYQDLVAASNRYPNQTVVGRLYVFYGGPSFDTIPDFIVNGEAASDWLPLVETSDFGVADLDQDGCDDLIFGASANDNYCADCGKGYLFFGSSSLSGEVTGLSADIVFAGNATDKYALGTTSNTGDFNGDGYTDVMISAPNASANTGSINIYYGNRTKVFENTSDKTIFNPTAGTRFGWDVLVASDINNDGYDDILTGKAYSFGTLYLFYGDADMDTVYDASFAAEKASDSLARGAVAIADINKDSYKDICMGAYQADPPGKTNAGRVYCFFGSSTLSGDKNVLSDANFVIDGAGTNDAFGRSISLGDTNNDGNQDLIVGAYQFNGSNNGYVDVYLGSGTSSFDTTYDVRITITPTGKRFGIEVLSGDIDGDGWPDLFLTSAHGGNGAADGVGRVYIFEVTHGNPQVQDEVINIESKTISGSVTDTINISGVQWSTTSDSSGEWHNCTPSDGAFNSTSEEFTCDLSGVTLTDGQQIYIRSYDENGLYMPSRLYVEVTVDFPEMPATGSNVSMIQMLIMLLMLSMLLIKLEIRKLKTPAFAPR